MPTSKGVVRLRSITTITFRAHPNITANTMNAVAVEAKTSNCLFVILFLERLPRSYLLPIYLDLLEFRKADYLSQLPNYFQSMLLLEVCEKGDPSPLASSIEISNEKSHLS